MTVQFALLFRAGICTYRLIGGRLCDRKVDCSTGQYYYVVYSVHSGIECKDEVFAAHQVQHADVKPALATPATRPLIGVPIDVPNGAIVAVIPPEEERPIPVTESIFTSVPQGMNKDFLMFSEDEGRTSESHYNFDSLGIRCCFI